MNVLIGFERTGRVRDAFLAQGHDAWSCDLHPSAAPGPHFHDDVFRVLEYGRRRRPWDLAIFHPPCTDLAVSGAKHFKKKRADGRQQAAVELFMKVVSCNVPRWCIENPVGIMSRLYRPPDQIIQTWQFGDPYQKTTCLWLKGLPPLFHWDGDSLFDFPRTHTHRGEFVEVVNKRTGKIARLPKWYSNAAHGKPGLRSNVRSETFPGIASAMAIQWGGLK